MDAELMPMCCVHPEDAEKFTEWMKTQAVRTNLDPDVLGYPRACMARLSRNDVTLAMLPLHPVVMLESLASSPELNDWALILGVVELDGVIEKAMETTGMCEAFFLTPIERFANTAESRGWIKALYDPEKKTWLMKKKVNNNPKVWLAQGDGPRQ